MQPKPRARLRRAAHHWSPWTGWLAACLLLTAGLLPTAAHAARKHKDKPPAAEPAPPPADAAPPADDTAAPADDGNGGNTQPALEPEGVKRSTPANAAEEMSWVQKRVAEDPFLQPFKAIGRAPEVKEFYNPLSRLQPTLQPQLSSYMVQDKQGRVIGNVSILVERQTSTLFGPMFHCVLQPDFSDRKKVDVWQSAITGKPLRVLRSQAVEATPDEAAASPAPGGGPRVMRMESLDSTYYFDRVVVTGNNDSGTITVSKRQRLLPYSFDMAQLPFLLCQLDFDKTDWPFEAALFDPSDLQPQPLQVSKPLRKDILDAEPATCQCWELPLRLGGVQLTWYVERAAPQRLIKFQLGTFTYTLQRYSIGSTK